VKTFPVVRLCSRRALPTLADVLPFLWHTYRQEGPPARGSSITPCGDFLHKLLFPIAALGLIERRCAGVHPGFVPIVISLAAFVPFRHEAFKISWLPIRVPGGLFRSRNAGSTGGWIRPSRVIDALTSLLAP
jgi:hypothetical protein